MKKTFVTKVISLLLCLCMVLPALTACSDREENVKETFMVSVLGEGAQLPYDALTTYAIEDDSVVRVTEEGYVSGLKKGETVVSLIKGDETEKYKIVVEDNREEEDKRFENFQDIDTLAALIGSGVNLLVCGNPTSSDCLRKFPIFDKQKLAASGNLERSNTGSVTTVSVSGSTMEDYVEDYSTKIKVGGSMKYGKLFSASIDTDFSSTSSIKNTTQTNYQKFYVTVERLTLGLSSSQKEMASMLSSEFIEDLYGLGKKVLTPEEVINKYGSHVLISASYGGRMDFTYFLSSTDSKVSKDTMSSVAAKVSTSISKFSADASGSYSKEAKQAAEKNNISIYEASSVIGGALLDMSSVESMKKNYQDWLSSLENENNCSMIGLVGPDSLYEIWGFLPDGARKNEFITYFARESNSSYNNLLKKYNRSSSQTVQITYGDYPQSEASVTVAKELKNGNGTVIGSLFTEGDILLYNDARYLAYTPSKSVNSYEAGKTYYFKFEPITWDFYANDTNGQSLYTTTAIIDCQQWYTPYESTYPPFSSLTNDEKLELMRQQIAEPLYEYYHRVYENNGYGDSAECGHFYVFLGRHYFSDIDFYAEDYYEENYLNPTKYVNKEYWETCTLRDFLNGPFVEYAFSDVELEGIGKVHTYCKDKGYIGKNTNLVMDYVSIAPNRNVKSGGNYYGPEIKATDFAYARGLTGATPFWASRSDFISFGNYCEGGWSKTAPGSYTYNANESDTWQFAGVGTDAFFGIRPTIAIK